MWFVMVVIPNSTNWCYGSDVVLAAPCHLPTLLLSFSCDMFCACVKQVQNFPKMIKVVQKRFTPYELEKIILPVSGQKVSFFDHCTFVFCVFRPWRTQERNLLWRNWQSLWLSMELNQMRRRKGRRKRRGARKMNFNQYNWL